MKNGIVDGTAHQNALDAFEAYSFNALGAVTTDDTIKSLYAAYTKRMRDEVGQKFQCVLYNHAADYEGVVNVKNKATEEEPALVYWVTGAPQGAQLIGLTLTRYMTANIRWKLITLRRS